MEERERVLGGFGPVLDKFRSFASGHVEDFLAARDRVLDLVGGSQRLMGGMAREDLLRQFLRRILPTSVSVDSGIVYGFEKVPNSKQIDVLVWDSSRNPPVFRGENFVVLAPESVIAAVSVKTHSGSVDIADTTQNLASLAPLDLAFRSHQPPIAKLGFFYSPVAHQSRACRWIAESFQEVLNDPEAGYLEQCLETLTAMDPVSPAQEHMWFFERLLPRLYVHLGDTSTSFVRGWGPPNLSPEEAAAEKLKRQPYVYPQGGALTTPLEKLAYHVLSETMSELGSKGWSLVSAWGDFHPQYHFRAGDAGELQESHGVAVELDGTTCSGGTGP